MTNAAKILSSDTLYAFSQFLSCLTKGEIDWAHSWHRESHRRIGTALRAAKADPGFFRS